MEINELKNAWSEYDKKLTENLKINEELLKRINLDKSKNELYKPMYLEIIAIVITFLIFISMAFYSVYRVPVFSILSLFTVIIALIYMSLSIIRIKAFLRIDYYNTPIVQLQHQITYLRMLTLRLRKIELILAIPFVLLIFPVLFKWIHNIDIFNYEYIIDPIIRLVIIFGVGIPLTLWFNKHFYDKKIENARYHLNEIEKFTKDE